MAENESRDTRKPYAAFYIADWLVEPGIYRISRDQKDVKVEPRVMDLLMCMASRPGEVMTREELEATVWAGMVVGYDSLTSAMIKLRKAFDDDPRNPQIFETVAKRGYRLIAPVTPQASQDEGQVTASPPARTDSKPPVARLARYITITVIVLGGILSVYTIWNYFSAGPVPVVQTQKPSGISLVVLPFTNSNHDSTQDYFSDGITDDLINDLSRISGLNVIARRTAYIYKNRQVSIDTIARELKVNYVLDGDVRRDGNRLRMNVQLIDASNGVNILARRFDSNTQDIFQVQDDIRKNIIKALALKLTEEERRREQVHYTSSFEAYDLFLQAQALIVSRASKADNDQALALLKKAIQLDPNFARAHAAMAYTLEEGVRLGMYANSEQLRREALAEGTQATRIDPNLPQAYWILGNVYLFLYQQHDKAIEMAKQAIKLAPYNNDGYTTLAVSYAYGGNPDKAVLICQQLMRNKGGYSSLIPSILGVAYLVKGNLPAALAAYNKSLEINPSYENAQALKVVILYRMGRKDDASFAFDEIKNLHPDFDLNKISQRFPFRDRSILDAIIADLNEAGASN